ncbi:hypothetical protein I302_105292 [Kwoniella bestiolae CBS 10118]|uniref:Uncharacterized protein n=1 Tax=Kwoniella bestiolae CBS 10118 TaxID=1296100 RepID=A0A1B9FSQ3_9TREE|nr:hypothetical protein I302_08580 [Kwoniella bestiolae CBS 10118]OCF21801.1 hypothetical protein I302_08580 [Kwoniella bestiolae CBS 10118]
MYPTRKAPSPPSFGHGEESLPPNHPFATYYIPPPPSYSQRVLHHSESEQSLRSSRYSSSPSSPNSGSTRSYKTQRSPTSSLAQPLSPSSSGRHPVLGHFAPQPLNRTISKPTNYGYGAPHPAYSRSSPPSPSPSYGNSGVPTELTLFDSKPKQTLLGDVEYIIGRKLHFPFLTSLTTKKDKKDKAEKEKRKMRRLTKEQYTQEGWEWEGSLQNYDLLPRDVVVFEKRRGRGVREGNYI